MCTSCYLRVTVRIVRLSLPPKLNFNIYAKETTARVLAATIGLLSIHSEIQEEIYQQIISVVGDERDPVRLFQSFLRL